MSKPSYPRARRVNAIVHEVVAEEIERLTDPRLAMVTITAVSVAPDMRRATVFFSSFDLSQLAEAQAGLRAAAPRLRLAIGREVRIKFTPVLEFVPDQGVLQGEKIEALLRELTSDKDEPTDE
jgi:ribosome-binding factor A